MTNHTKLTAAALFSALVLGSSFVSSTVFADDTGTGTDTGTPADTSGTTADPATTVVKTGQQGPNKDNGGTQTETGNAYVEITTNTDGNPVVDPKDPGEPVKPDDPNVTKEIGSLTLDAIPRTLNFGKNVATGAAAKYALYSNDPDSRASDDTRGNAISDTLHTTDTGTDTENNHYKGIIFAQETNISSSADVAWTLNAKLNKFTNYSTGADSLPGAYITLASGASKILNTNAETGAKSWDDATDVVADGVTTKGATLPKDGVTLTSGDDAGTPIVSGVQRKGTFQQQWTSGNVNLVVPQAATVGQYQATIDWTLSAEPSTLDAAPAAN